MSKRKDNLTVKLLKILGEESICFVFNCVLVYEGARIAYMPGQRQNTEYRLGQVIKVTNGKLSVIKYNRICLLVRTRNLDVIKRLLDSSDNFNIKLGRTLGYPYVYEHKNSGVRNMKIEYVVRSKTGVNMSLYSFIIPKHHLTTDMMEEIIFTRDAYSRALNHTVSINLN